MKTILTEWGEMPLNDWREIKLASAHRCARAHRSARHWANSISAAFALASAYVALDGLIEIISGSPLRSIGSLLFAFVMGAMAVSTFYAGIELSSEFLLKRQEIVDEVSAVIRTFK